MEQIATVKSVDGGIAVIEVSRKAMCDGCHKSECGSGCPMSGIFSGGSSMTANAKNKVGALPGDTVEINTADSTVLVTALAVFILPIAIGGLFYVLAQYLRFNTTISYASAVVGFILPFLFLKIADSGQKKKEPRITVVRILHSCDSTSDVTET